MKKLAAILIFLWMIMPIHAFEIGSTGLEQAIVVRITDNKGAEILPPTTIKYKGTKNVGSLGITDLTAAFPYHVKIWKAHSYKPDAFGWTITWQPTERDIAQEKSRGRKMPKMIGRAKKPNQLLITFLHMYDFWTLKWVEASQT